MRLVHVIGLFGHRVGEGAAKSRRHPIGPDARPGVGRVLAVLVITTRRRVRALAAMVCLRPVPSGATRVRAHRLW